MIKFYFLYLLSGLATLAIDLFVWGLSSGPVNIFPYLVLYSSFSLFVIAPGLALFYPKIAAVAGGMFTLGTIPFQIFLIKDGFRGDTSFLLIPALCLFCLVSAIRLLVNKATPDTTALKLPVKIFLCLVPVAVLACCVIGMGKTG